MWQSHHLAVRFVGMEDAGTYTSDVFGQRHDQLLPYGVDGRVGDLGKLLAEVVEEHLRPVAQHGKWRVVAHRGGRLLSAHSHRHYRCLDVFSSIAEQDFFLPQVGNAILYMPSALQLLQLYAVGRQPLLVRMLLSQLPFDFSVVVDLSLLRVDEQYLTRLQASLLYNLRRVEVHDARLRCHHHRVVGSDGVAGRSQPVAVEHATGKPAVGKEQGSRTVPGFHQDGVVLVERLQVFRDGVLVVERLRHQHAHGVGQRQSRHDKELQHVV